MNRTPRQFRCRDDLWTRVEALAKRRGITTDDVIQAALVQLFTKKKKDEAEEAAPPPRSPTKPPTAPSPPPRAATPTPVPKAPPAAAAPVPMPARPRPTATRLPPPSSNAAPAAVAQRARTLWVYFEGEAYPIETDQFIIGRGAKYSDLAIKDANISRRHCAVVRRNGQYYIKDLESTNGVEYQGERVDDHLVQEGAVYRLCDHELRFSYVPPP